MIIHKSKHTGQFLNKTEELLILNTISQNPANLFVTTAIKITHFEKKGVISVRAIGLKNNRKCVK